MINGRGIIKKFTTQGVLIDSIANLLTDGWGLTYGAEHLWASDPSKDMIYRISTPPAEQFIRGDADGSGGLTIGDGLYCFRCQFVPGWTDSCRCDDAVDADDNGAISIGDCLRILRKQFVPGWQDSIPPPCCTAPVDCGVDPTEDELGCEEHPACGTGKGKIVSEQKATGREQIQRRE